MLYPAILDLIDDDVISAHPTAFRVYVRLLRRHPNIFMHAQDVKVWAVAKGLRTNNREVIAALNLLVRRGYLLEHGRGLNNVRQFTLASERRDPPDVHSQEPAA